MKKLLFILCILIVCLNSCTSVCTPREYKAKIGTNIQEIDGCEYYVSHNGYGNIITHKGNCKNPIHYNIIHDTIYVVVK